MKISKTITLLLLVFFSCGAFAAVSPFAPASTNNVHAFKFRDFEKLTGKKLGFFQKIKLKLAQSALRKLAGDEITEKQKRKAEISMILGISSIALLLLSSVAFLGFAGLLAFPAGVLAVVFGAQSLKGNSNSKGIIGVVTGGVTVLLVALVILLLAVFFASWA